MGKRIDTIDTLRGIAIAAVVLDHTMSLFPFLRSELLWRHTFFSVPWFIFLSGAVNAHSAIRQKPHDFLSFYLTFLWRRSGIIAAFLFATTISYMSTHWDKLDSGELKRHMLSFSAQPTYYFLNILLQLYLIFPLLFWVMRYLLPASVQQSAHDELPSDQSVVQSPENATEESGRAEAGSLHNNTIVTLSLFTMATVCIVDFAWLFEILGYPGWPFNPARRLFGSIYFVVFWLGMLAAQFGVSQRWFFWLITLELFVIMEWALNATQGNFLGLTPTIPYILWSISLLSAVYLTMRVMPIPAVIRSTFAVFGRYSIWIYLYHYFILLLLLRYKPLLLTVPSPVAVLFLFMISLSVPLIIGKVWRALSM